MSAAPGGLPESHGMAASAPSAVALELSKLGISFGGLRAVHDFSLTLPPESLYGLIGPNGAGKTTVFNLLTGVYSPDCGSMRLGGKNLIGRLPHEIAAAGIARTFQNIRLFDGLSVLENVCLAAQLRHPASITATVFRGRHFLECERQLRDCAEVLLDVLELNGLADAPARSLSYGHQRRLEIARALATRPRVLLLDEPAAGMNPLEKRALAAMVRGLPRRFQVSVLLIDHDMQLVMGVCERITVLDHGETIADGPPAAIQTDPRVVSAYLGEPTDAGEPLSD